MGKSGTWKELFSFNESYKNKINITINIVNIRLYFIGLKKINLKCYLTLFYNTEMYALHGCSYTFIYHDSVVLSLMVVTLVIFKRGGDEKNVDCDGNTSNDNKKK